MRVSAGGSTPTSATAVTTWSSSRLRAPSARCTSARTSRPPRPDPPRLLLIVSDIQAARDELAGRGVQVSEVFHYAGFNRVDPGGLSGPAPDRQSYGSWVSFSDPDGNGWLLQEITTRLPGRVAGETTYSSVADLAAALRRAAPHTASTRSGPAARMT